MASTIESYTVDDTSSISTDATQTDVGMSFTIGTTGTNLDYGLTSISFQSFRVLSPGIITVSVYNVDPDGLPTGAAISTGTFDGDTETVTDSVATPWRNVLMTSATLKASTQYVLALAGSTTDAANTIGMRADHIGGAYTGGGLTLRESGVWSNAEPAIDLMFAVYGGDYAGTLCTFANAVNKAGSGVSAAAKTEALVSDFVRQAEGVIASVTRFDWVGAYGSVSDDYRGILNDVASNLAAIYMISYDLPDAGDDRVNAETQINVFRESIARDLSLLRNQEVKTFLLTGE